MLHIHLDSKMMDKMLYIVGKRDTPHKITTICFIVLLIDRYNYLILPLLLIPNIKIKFMDLIVNWSTPCQ